MNNLLKYLLLALCVVSPLTLRSDEEINNDTSVQTEEERVTQDLSFTNTTHNGSNHIFMGVTFYGDMLEIEDGSFWTISPDQRWKTFDWFPGDVILITQASFWSSYEFSFYNIRTGQSLDVEASVGPIFGSFYRRYIVSLDFFYGDASVMLDDGSIWVLPESQRYIWERWYINDSITIGSNNETFGSVFYPNLLINLTCGQTFFTTKCLN